MSGTKPLGRKAYGSIGHLPNSRLGPGDHAVHEGQARICTEKARPGDIVVVQEKLDGSCVAVACIDGRIVPLIRAGYPAIDSRREFHRDFHRWVMDRERAFHQLLDEGERVVGEWLALAHGTRYTDIGLPFVAFDIMRDADRATARETEIRCEGVGLDAVHTVHSGGPLPVDEAMALIGGGSYGTHPDDGPEGVVYRVERDLKVDFLAKWVNPDKVDGKYLPEIADAPPVWNWKAER